MSICYFCKQIKSKTFYIQVKSGEGYSWPDMKAGVYRPKTTSLGEIIQDEWIYIGSKTKMQKGYLYLQYPIRGGCYESSPLRITCYTCQNTTHQKEMKNIFN